jgi:DNA-binding beta-propeller fold protein YncE
MNTKHFATMLRRMLVLVPLALAAGQTFPLAQQAAGPTNCLAPMAEPITVVKTQGQMAVPTPSRDGCWLYLIVDRQAAGGTTGVAVFKRNGNTFQEVRTVAIPVTLPRAGLALTPDDTMLVASSENVITLFDVAKLHSADGDPTLGQIKGQQGSSRVAMAPDGRAVFVVLFGANRMAVIDLERARKNGFSADAIAPTYVPTGRQPIHPVVSPDSRFVYATNLFAPDIMSSERKCFQGQQPQGALQVVDVQRAKADPATATVGWTFPAGCGANAIAVSPDGRRVSNAAADSIFAAEALPSELHVYDTTAVGTGTPPARIARIGLSRGPTAIIDTGDRILVGFQATDGVQPDIMVIDPSKASAGNDAVVGTIPFPGANLGLSSDRRTLFTSALLKGGIGIIDLHRVTIQPRAR